MTYWLLHEPKLAEIQALREHGMNPSASDLKAFAESAPVTAAVVEPVGGDARVSVRGVLTNAPDFWLWLMDIPNTTYPDIMTAIAAATIDPRVSRIVLDIDSPGGEVSGLWPVLDAIHASAKPVRAEVSGMAASAAYAIASQADEIVADNRGDMFGSIGVAAQFRVNPAVVDITSTDAPDKRPNGTTLDGAAVVRKQLDAIHALFVESIARGRNVTAEKINAEFGRGAVVLAEDARARGMIDGIKGAAVAPSVSYKPAAYAVQKQEQSMDLATLKAQHPAVFQAAVDAGVKTERDRVVAHMTMGEQSGDMKTAAAAIRDGSDMTQTLQAAYMSAAMNRAAVTGRVTEGAAVATAATPGAPEAVDSEAQKVLKIVTESVGA